MSTEQQDWLDDRQVRDTNGTQDEQPGTEDITTEANGDEITARSAFAPEHFNEVTLIMLMRVYDLQLALLSALDPEKAAALVELHANGQSFCPPPAFAEYADENS